MKYASTVDKMLLTDKEAAYRLGVSQSTIWNLIRAGDLRPVRIGRLVRFPVGELERFIAERPSRAVAR